jgi:thiosulfate reductase / polysulfide reductase chain A
MCAEGSKRAKQATDGNNSYNSYDYRNTNYILNFGASFLEAFRPYNYLMQMWGHMRTKSPQTRITTIDVRMNPTMAASDRALYIKPATDGAMALAIAHVMLTEGLWDKEFVGDFRDGRHAFRAGRAHSSGQLRGEAGCMASRSGGTRS